MENKPEVILRNTKLENVFSRLLGKLKQISGLQVQDTFDDGTIIEYQFQPVFPSSANKIELKYGTATIPKGDIQKSHGHWENYVAMSFTVSQLQNDTVVLQAEYNRRFTRSLKMSGTKCSKTSTRHNP